MVVRVKIKVSAGGRFVEAPALANSGYESGNPPVNGSYEGCRRTRPMASKT